MNRLVGVMSVAALGLCAGCPADAPDGAAAGAPAPRAIVLVTVDGLVSSEVAAFGGPRATPALADLAARGGAWASAWTAVPMTRPAVATYLTGLAPDRHGVTDDLFTGLAKDVPTLATELTAAGYRTAAFPDSSFLGPSSGLLRGFEVAADTPPIPIQPWRWLPYTRPPEELATELETWLATLPSGSRYFAWLHFSQPLIDAAERIARATSYRQRGMARRPESRIQKGIETFDAALGRVVAALEARGDLASGLVLVVGTLGDISGGEDEAPGPGMSLARPAIAVPVVLRLPGGRSAGRGADATVWAPDIASTIASAAGVRLADGAEGIALTEPAPDDRMVFAWTWAVRDQLGLAPARLARSGAAVVTEGPAVARPDPEAAPDVRERLTVALGARSSPQPIAIPLERAREILDQRGLKFAPRAVSDIPEMDAASRREAARILWTARYFLKTTQRRVGYEALQDALRLAPDAPAVRLDLGQFGVLYSERAASDVLRRGVEMYPTDPEMLHWYAHAIWRNTSWQEAETLLLDVLPYKAEEGDMLYDLACTRSLAEDLDASVTYLRRAIEAGFRDWGLMETDTDLRALRESGRFAEVLRDYRR